MRALSVLRRSKCSKFLPPLYVSFLLHCMATCASTLSASQPALLAEIQDSLGTRGARATIRQFFDCGQASPVGYNVIETGDPPAMQLAATLLMYSDGCVSESLHSAIATALQRQPEAVLRFFAAHTLEPSSNNCIPMMIEQPRAQVEATLERTEESLETVTKPSLQSAKAACMRRVAEYRKAMDGAAAWAQEQESLNSAVKRAIQAALASQLPSYAVALSQAQRSWMTWMRAECRLEALVGNVSKAPAESQTDCGMRMMRERTARIAAVEATLRNGSRAGR